jgi:glycolate oxidase FAD binding subunit
LTLKTEELDRKVWGMGLESVPPHERALYAVDEKIPKWVVFPKNAEQAASLIKVAAETGAAITLWGGGSVQEMGNTTRQLDIVLGTKHLSGILEHEPADLTITVAAGTPFKQVQDHLSRFNQRLPWEVPFPERATIGEALAGNVSGPSRHRWGTARDFLIGIKVILADGALVKNGGKVVKNVTGYDLKKLFIGSMGTLGLIVEATLKVVPRPSGSLTVNASFSTQEDLFAVLASPELPFLFPEALDYWRLQEAAWGLSARFIGAPEAMKRQADALSKICQGKKPKALIRLEGDGEARWWDRLIHAPRKEIAGATRVRFSLPSSELGGFTAAAIRLFPAALFSGRAGQGTGWMMIPTANVHEPEDPQFKELIRSAQRFSGTLFLESCPPVWKQNLDMWLTPLPETFLLKRIKEAFDPQNIFSPGRFVGRI